MTIREAEFERRFEDHVRSARLARGGMVTKGAAYYGDAFEDKATRERTKSKCRELVIDATFVEGATTRRMGLSLRVQGV